MAEIHRLIVKLQAENAELKKMYNDTVKQTEKLEKKLDRLQNTHQTRRRRRHIKANIRRIADKQKAYDKELRLEREHNIKMRDLERKEESRRRSSALRDKAARAKEAMRQFTREDKLRVKAKREKERHEERAWNAYGKKITNNTKKRNAEQKKLENQALRDKADRIRQHANNFIRLDKNRVKAANKTAGTISKIRRQHFKTQSRLHPDQKSRISREARAKQFSKAVNLHGELPLHEVRSHAAQRKKMLAASLTLRQKLTAAIVKGTNSLKNHGRTAVRVTKEQISLQRRLYLVRERNVANAITNPRAAIRSVGKNFKNKVGELGSGLKSGIGTAAAASIDAARTSLKLLTRATDFAKPKLVAVFNAAAIAASRLKSIIRDLGTIFKEIKNIGTLSFNAVTSVVRGLHGWALKLAHGFINVGRSLRSLSLDLRSVGRRLTYTVTLPIVALGTAAVKTFATFETEITKLRSLVGLSEATVSSFSDKILKMTSVVGRSPAELAKGLFFITSSGERGAASLDILRDSAKAAAVGLGETKLIADLTTSAINAYGKENISSTRAVDDLIAAVNEGKAEATDFAEQLGRVIPVAAELNIEFNQLTGTIAAMTRTGTPVNTAVIQLRQILSSVIKPSREAQKVLEQKGLGKSQLLSIVKNSGVLGLLDVLKQEFGHDTEATGAVFGNIRALTGILDLLGKNLPATEAILQRMKNTTGSLEEAFKAVSNTIEFKFSQAISSIKAEFIELVKSFRPAIISMIETVKKWIKWFSKLHPAVKRTTVLVLALVAAVGPLLSLIGFALVPVAALATAIGTLGVVLLSVLGTIGSLTLGLVGLAATLGGIAVSIFKIFTTRVGLGVGALALFHRAVQTATPTVENSKTIVERLGKSIETLKKSASNIGQIFKNNFGTIGDVFEDLKGKAGQFIDYFKNSFKLFKEAIAAGEVKAGLKIIGLQLKLFWLTDGAGIFDDLKEKVRVTFVQIKNEIMKALNDIFYELEMGFISAAKLAPFANIKKLEHAEFLAKQKHTIRKTQNEGAFNRGMESDPARRREMEYDQLRIRGGATDKDIEKLEKKRLQDKIAKMDEILNIHKQIKAVTKQINKATKNKEFKESKQFYKGLFESLTDKLAKKTKDLFGFEKAKESAKDLNDELDKNKEKTKEIQDLQSRFAVDSRSAEADRRHREYLKTLIPLGADKPKVVGPKKPAIKKAALPNQNRIDIAKIRLAKLQKEFDANSLDIIEDPAKLKNISSQIKTQKRIIHSKDFGNKIKKKAFGRKNAREEFAKKALKARNDPKIQRLRAFVEKLQGKEILSGVDKDRLSAARNKLFQLGDTQEIQRRNKLAAPKDKVPEEKKPKENVDKFLKAAEDTAFGISRLIELTEDSPTTKLILEKVGL